MVNQTSFVLLAKVGLRIAITIWVPTILNQTRPIPEKFLWSSNLSSSALLKLYPKQIKAMSRYKGKHSTPESHVKGYRKEIFSLDEPPSILPLHDLIRKQYSTKFSKAICQQSSSIFYLENSIKISNGNFSLKISCDLCS
jgi:hypothetical protein